MRKSRRPRRTPFAAPTVDGRVRCTSALLGQDDGVGRLARLDVGGDRRRGEIGIVPAISEVQRILNAIVSRSAAAPREVSVPLLKYPYLVVFATLKYVVHFVHVRRRRDIDRI